MTGFAVASTSSAPSPVSTPRSARGRPLTPNGGPGVGASIGARPGLAPHWSRAGRDRAASSSHHDGSWTVRNPLRLAIGGLSPSSERLWRSPGPCNVRPRVALTSLAAIDSAHAQVSSAPWAIERRPGGRRARRGLLQGTSRSARRTLVDQFHTNALVTRLFERNLPVPRNSVKSHSQEGAASSSPAPTLSSLSRTTWYW
jgi:hypothetical protein